MTKKIKIDLHRDNRFSKQGADLIRKFYMLDDETSPQESMARAAEAYCYGDYELAQRIYDYASKGWFFFASPVLSNAPKGKWQENFHKNKSFWESKAARKSNFNSKLNKGLPISCYLMTLGDTIDGQMNAAKELAVLSVSGGGVGIYNEIRAISDKAPGPIPYMKTIDSNIGYYRQGKTRRGSVAVYMDIDHPDIVEFIKIRVPSGGDPERKVDNRKSFHNAINITEKFVQAVEQDLDWDLKCPHSGEIRETLNARYLWELILDTRVLTGEPYINMIDVVNNSIHQAHKDLGYFVNQSNLCVTGDTKVYIKGSVSGFSELTIKEFNKKFNEKTETWEVWSFNIEKNIGEWKKVENSAMTNPKSKVIKITDSETGKSITCTPDHKIYTKNRGYVMAKELKEDDLLIIG